MKRTVLYPSFGLMFCVCRCGYFLAFANGTATLRCEEKTLLLVEDESILCSIVASRKIRLLIEGEISGETSGESKASR